LFYFGMLYVFDAKNDAVKRDKQNMGVGYTNALRDIAQKQLLEDRANLKYAALDCWKAVAENLPDSMTVELMFFQRGKLELNGTILADSPDDVGTFNEALRSATDANHKPLFSDVSPQTTHMNNGKGDWRFSCVLKNEAEAQ
jgi:hypothetical protein